MLGIKQFLVLMIANIFSWQSYAGHDSHGTAIDIKMPHAGEKMSGQSFNQIVNSKAGKKINITWEDVNGWTLLEKKEMGKLFAHSFLAVYRKYHTQDHFTDDQIEKRLIKYFEKFIMPRFQQNARQYFLSARMGEKVVGFIFWDEVHQNEAYIAELAIDPAYWKQGLGRNFINSILYKKPNIKRISLLTARINKGAQIFYESLGFQPSTYLHEGYSPEEYCAYEWLNKNGKDPHKS